MLNHELFFLDELKLNVSASAAVTALVNCKHKIISLEISGWVWCLSLLVNPSVFIDYY